MCDYYVDNGTDLELYVFLCVCGRVGISFRLLLSSLVEISA